MGLSVSIVIVSFNTGSALAECLSRVPGSRFEVIVVDNGSTDGSRELVRSEFPWVRLIEPETNLGFGAGLNAGIEVAGGDSVLLLNSDAWPIDDAVDQLLSYMERHPRIGVLGPRLRNPDGTLQRSIRGFPTPWRIATEYFFLRKLAPRSNVLNAFYAGPRDHSRTCEAEFLTGAVLLCRREALQEIGGFDEDFFMFSEETDLCYRMREAGWKVEFYAGAEFVHVGGASTKAEWGTMYREQLRGHLRFLSKHQGPGTAERTRHMLIVSLRLRTQLFPGERGESYRRAADWLASVETPALLQSRQ